MDGMVRFGRCSKPPMCPSNMRHDARLQLHTCPGRPSWYGKQRDLLIKVATDTQSLRSSVPQSVWENSSAYHRHHDRHYILSDDEREQDRLDMQHKTCLRTFGRKLTLALIEGHALKDVLEYWHRHRNVVEVGARARRHIRVLTKIPRAIDFVDEHPDSNMRGTDLSPMQPKNASQMPVCS